MGGNGKIAILGATGGLGRALCRRLSENGARLFLGGRDEEALAALARVAWLLSPAASWVTGQVWGIDGGLGAVKLRPVARLAAATTKKRK